MPAKVQGVLGRNATPEEQAEGILWLAGPQHSIRHRHRPARGWRLDRLLTAMRVARVSAPPCQAALVAVPARAQSRRRRMLNPVPSRCASGSMPSAASWAMDGLWAGLAPSYGGAGFSQNGRWGDFDPAPGVTAETATLHCTQRAGLSASLGGTLGTDLHGAGNTGRAMLEDLRLGLTTPQSDPTGPLFDLRAGRFCECFDGGFLLCQATVNGSERGLIMELLCTA